MNVPSPARFVVGIDLGTTNSAMAFAELTDPAAVRTLPVPQLIAPGEVEARETLPSFHYEPAPGEGLDDPASRRLPWGDVHAPGNYLLGPLAQERGNGSPGRLIASAKSWLSHTGVDRSADLLPWHGDGDVARLPPAEVSARYLDHLRAAWDHAHPDAPLAEQEVVLTIPASFDEVARGLTLAAARRAGLPRVTLLEEPQAAFYAWVAGDAVRAATMALGERILVCDIGGGTTDFTLIEAREGGKFHRVAVGDHLILGGDNLDLALAHHVEARLGPPALTARQWGTLVRRCQAAKETLLGPDAPESLGISLPAATGARLVGGARNVELTRKEVTALLVDGFLPWVNPDARPVRRASGFQEFGLPYAPDPGITRYLAAFLSTHGGGRLDAVLLNGGFFASTTLRNRLLVVLESWFGTEPPRVLTNPRLDLAVALGAVRYGLARRGVGAVERITGGLARSFYVGVRQGERDVAMCLAPAGLEENAEVSLEDRRFELRVRQPAEFPLWSSSTRLQDQPGDVLPTDDPGLLPLPALRTSLRGRAADEKTPLSTDGGDAVIPVRLRARLTELGTLEVWCAEEGGTRQWKLPFDVRATLPEAGEDGTSPAEVDPGGSGTALVEETTAARARALVRETFGRTGTPPDAESLVRRLETLLDLPRADWPPVLLRELADELPALEEVRRRAPAFESRWLNFLGFCLRPGYGFPSDEARVTAAWRLCGERRFFHPRHDPTRAEWAILWRRLAGGLTAGQQRSLAAPLLAELRRNGGRDWAKQETAEVWRALGALELLDPTVRVDLGEHLLTAVETPGSPVPVRAALWALGRLGARAPLAGPLNAALPAETAEAWLERLLAQEFSDAHDELAFTLTQLARRTGDRYRDLPELAREQVLARLTALGSEAHALELVRDGGRLQTREREAAFGDSLPRGLRLASA